MKSMAVFPLLVGCAVVCAQQALTSVEPPQPIDQQNATGEVWDSESGQWRTLKEYAKVLIDRGTRGVLIEQVPFTARNRALQADGMSVLTVQNGLSDFHANYRQYERDNGKR